MKKRPVTTPKLRVVPGARTKKRHPEPRLIVSERVPIVTIGERYPAVCTRYEWRRNNRRLVLVCEVEDDEGRRGTVRKWLTIREHISPNTKLGQLYEQILTRPLELGDRILPNKFVGCVFSVTIGWSGKVGGRYDFKTALHKKGSKDFLRIHDLKFVDFDPSRAPHTSKVRKAAGVGPDPLTAASPDGFSSYDFERWYLGTKPKQPRKNPDREPGQQPASASQERMTEERLKK